MKRINIFISILFIVSMIACNNSSINGVNEDSEVITDAFEPMDSAEQPDNLEPINIKEPNHQMNDDEQARQAYKNGDAETLKRLARQGNSTAIDLCESAGIQY